MAFRTIRSESTVAQYVVLGGPATEAVTGSAPVRLLNLPARAAEPVLSVAADGAVRKGVLVAGDIPAPFTQDSVAETITQPWTWNGVAILFTTAGVAPPSASSRSLGTRIVYFPAVPSDVDYAVGIAADTLWQSVPGGAQLSWYQGSATRLRLLVNGTLRLENGTGTLELASTTGGTTIIGGTSLTIASSGHILATTSATGALYPSKGYWSNLGLLSSKWLSLHAAELWVETLVAQNTMATIGGRILVGPTTTLVKPQTDSAEFFGVFVKHNQMANEDRVRLEANGKFEIWRVISAPSTLPPDAEVPFTHYSYAVQRILGGPWTWDAGDAVFNTGQTGNGFIDLYSVRGVKASDTGVSSEFGPTIVGNVRASLAATDWQPRWAIGHLSGVYGNAPTVYGTAFGDPDSTYLQVDATNGVQMVNAAKQRIGHWTMGGSVMFGPPDQGRLMFDAPTGTLKLQMAGTDRIVLNTDGNAYLAAALVCGALSGTTGTVRSSGATGWNTGAGFYFNSINGGATTALIGTAGGNRIQFDGSDVYVKTGAVTVLPATGISVLSPTGNAHNPAYGVNITSALYGGHASLWGYEGPNEVGWGHRLLVLDNQTTTPSTYAKHLIQGEGRQTSGAAAQAYAFTLESNAQYNFSELKFIGGYTTYLTPQFRIVGSLLLGTDSRNAIAQLDLTLDSAMKPGGGSWSATPSNADAKTDIEDVDPVVALALVRQAPIKRFRYTGKYGAPAGMRTIGMLAHEAEAIMPASVTWLQSGAAAWNAHELLMLNIAAVQALAARIDSLEGR